MYKVKTPDSLLCTVEVEEPVDDGKGGVEPFDFKMRFKYLPVDELNPVLAQLSIAPKADTVIPYVLGWDGIANEEGPIPFTEDNLRFVMNKTYLLIAINKAFIACQVGRDRKN